MGRLFKTKIPNGPNHGYSRKGGEAKQAAAAAIAKYADQYGLSAHEKEELLKLVEQESGFNP